MSVIVACPKEGVLIADNFVLETPKDDSSLFGKNEVLYKDKITVTKNNQFAYVYLKEQEIKCTEIILQLIHDYESGKEITVKSEEVKALLKSPLVVMTKRNMYFIDGAKLPLFNIMFSQVSNIFNSQTINSAFDLTAEEYFNTCVRNAIITATRTMQRVEQKSLKLIPLAKKKKGVKE